LGHHDDVSSSYDCTPLATFWLDRDYYDRATLKILFSLRSMSRGAYRALLFLKLPFIILTIKYNHHSHSNNKKKNALVGECTPDGESRGFNVSNGSCVDIGVSAGEEGWLSAR
jgi:hypothetical protein